MAVAWHMAGTEEIDRLTALRLTVLRAANGLAPDAPLPGVAEATRDYYARAIADGSCVICIGEDNGEIVSCGAVCFYAVMPTCDDPKGQKAYVMNMYTAPAYRRQGLARQALSMLVAEARRRGVDDVSLEATAQGRPLYEQFGFVPSEHEMHLP